MTYGCLIEYKHRLYVVLHAMKHVMLDNMYRHTGMTHGRVIVCITIYNMQIDCYVRGHTKVCM